MNKEDIITWASESGFVVDEASKQYQPKCIGLTHYLIDDELERFAAIAFAAGAAAEREACAKVCDLVAREIDDTNGTASYIAAAIRARGETK